MLISCSTFARPIVGKSSSVILPGTFLDPGHATFTRCKLVFTKKNVWPRHEGIDELLLPPIWRCSDA